MQGKLYNSFRRITTNKVYFPEIDGIRFLAILMVVCFHSFGYLLEKGNLKAMQGFEAHPWFNQLLSNGGRGVQLFFVLSGFILCMPFAHQYINHGKKTDVKKYYLRRLTRLEPPYIIAMIGIFCLQIVMHIYTFKALLPHLLASLVYSHGLIYHHEPIITVVAWSLEVEIQFYLIAPLLFRLLKLSAVTRRSVLVIGALGFICLQHYVPTGFESIYSEIQYFLMGILLADLYVSNYAHGTFNKVWAVPAAVIALAFISYLPFHHEFYAQLWFPFLIAFLYYTIMKNHALKKVFSFKFIPVIGGMCYSIYLVHYTIISFVGRYATHIEVTQYFLPNLFIQLSILCIAVLLVSSIFYFFIERPFMSQKWINLLYKKNKKYDDAADAELTSIEEGKTTLHS